MSGVVFIISARNRACPSYYTYHAQFAHVDDGLLFRLLLNVLVDLKYSGLYKFSSCMDGNPVLTAMFLYRCGEVYWWHTAVKNWFLSYKLVSVDAYVLKEDLGKL